MPLTDITIRSLRAEAKPRKVSDSDGLYLLVAANGSKLWRYDYRFQGKRLTLSFGKWPAVGLASARRSRDDARAQLELGVDPRKVEERTDSFRAVGDRWLAGESERWTDTNTDRVKRTLAADVYPSLGDRPIARIEPPDVLATLRTIEARGVRETTHRIRGYIGGIFRFGIAEGLCQRDMAADVRDALKPKRRTEHRAKFKEDELGDFLCRLDTRRFDDATCDALLFTMLTVGRTSEIRFARAEEFEHTGDETLWRIPAERMKRHREHLVPLSRQAREIVLKRIAETKGGHLFAARQGEKPISENTMLYGLYRLGYHSKATVHGFRGTFSTIANEYEWNRDWVEMALAHSEDSVRSAYNSALYLPQRRELLQWWADMLDEKRAGEISKTLGK